MKITREDDFGGAVLNCAVRYCLGRYSYMPSLVMNYIRPLLPDCSNKTLWCFERDISEFLNDWERNTDTHMFGDPYTKEWAQFREDVVQEQFRRENNK